MNTPNAEPSVLFAVNDLSVSKPTYDFITFLRLAELHRVRHGYDQIYFIFVPGPKDGFRNDNLPPNDPEELRSMVRNVALPACWLLPSCAGVSYFSTRSDAKTLIEKSGTDIFPRGYTVENPVAEYMWSSINSAMLREEKLTQFSAPQEYLDQAKDYVKLVGENKKLITITLRESNYYPERNSQLNEWKKFADYLDSSKYAVVIIRETKNAHLPPLFDSIPECPLAAISLLFRTALYQNAYANLFISNGPSSLSSHAFCPMISFGVLTATHVASSENFLKNVFGFSEGDQQYGFPSSQSLVWGRDNFETIRSEFEKLVSLLEKYPNGDVPPHGFRSDTQLVDTCAGVLHDTTFKMQRTCFPEDRDTLLKIIELTDGRIAEAHNLLGVWYSKTGKPEEAKQAIRKAITVNDKFKLAYLNLAAISQNTGHVAEALAIYMDVLDRIETSPDIIANAYKCAVSLGNKEAIDQLIKKAEATEMNPEGIEQMKKLLMA